jgi:hypothetical protein
MSELILDSSPQAQAIQALRQNKAHLLDPVGFFGLEALHHRASAYEGNVRSILNAKILQLAQTCAARVAQASHTAGGNASVPKLPAQQETLEGLVRRMAHQDSDPLQSRGGDRPGTPTELRAVKYFRSTWSKLSVNKQIQSALDKAPQNAGPINSHMVALRSLAHMRDISPDYLNRFMTHIDTLMRLELTGKEIKPTRARSR